MSYRIEFTTAAAHQVKNLPRQARSRVLSVIDGLAMDPRPREATLVGEDIAWCIRVGDYRVI